MNKTYKLIKEYPGSPKLGTKIFYNINQDLYELEKPIGNQMYIDINSEFWQRLLYLADEFQVLELKYESNLLPTSPKGKLFNTKKEAEKYHKSLQFKFEIGKWYKNNDELFYCTKIENNNVYGYGINSLNNWREGRWDTLQNDENFKLVLYSEVHQLLLEYIKSKYFIEDKIQLEKDVFSTIKDNF